MASYIGRRMDAVYVYVHRHPGCTKLEVDDAVASHRQNGYASVNRAIRQGLIRAKPSPRRPGQWYALYAN